MLARDLMTTAVVTVEPATTVRHAARILEVNGFTALPVVDGVGQVCGIVSEADVVRGIRHDARSPLLAAEMAVSPPRSVREVMTADVVTVAPWADVADVFALMQLRGIRSVPVVEPGGVLAGILSRRDLVRTVGTADTSIEAGVRRRLGCYAGPDRWDVEVHDGTVTLSGACEDPAERHTAAVIAGQVPGVADVVVAAPGTSAQVG
jgi:CBS domain-containing protein